MSATIEINVKDLSPLKEFYTLKAAEIRRNIEENNAQLEEVIKVIRELEEKLASVKQPSLYDKVYNHFSKVNGTHFLADYSPKFTWEKKAIYFLEKGITLSTSDIADFIVQAEPGLDRKRVMSSLSATLSQKLYPEGVFVRKTSDRGEYIYELSKNDPGYSVDVKL